MSSNMPHDFEGNAAAEKIQEDWIRDNPSKVKSTEEV